MCYITESAIDEEISQRKKQQYRCERCDCVTHELTKVDYQTVSDSAKYEAGLIDECPVYEIRLCNFCCDAIEKDAEKILV